jgi:hypothetical protein
MAEDYAVFEESCLILAAAWSALVQWSKTGLGPAAVDK